MNNQIIDFVKTCIKCSIEKKIDNFPLRDKSKGTYRNECKQCRKEYLIENKEKFREVNKNWRLENKDKIKEQNKNNMYNWLLTNKVKNDEYKKKYRLENGEKISETKKKWYIENRELINIKRAKYRIEHKEQLQKISKERWKKVKDNPILKLKDSIRKLVYITIKNQGYSKKSHTYEVLGCSYEDFKIYIESKFLEEMNWKNYGEWHLDHITPISWATTEKEVYLYSHYSNFQPLWSFDNISKLNRYSG